MFGETSDSNRTSSLSVLLQNGQNVENWHGHVDVRIYQAVVIVFGIRNAYAEQMTLVTENRSATLASLNAGIRENNTSRYFGDSSLEDARQELIITAQAGEMRKTGRVHQLTWRKSLYYFEKR